MTLMDVGILAFVLVCFFLICVVLLQPGKGDATAIGFGGSSQSIFGSRGAGNFLTKTTAVLAGLFFLSSFLLTKSRMSVHSNTDIRSNLPIEASPSPTPQAKEPGAASGSTGVKDGPKASPKVDEAPKK